MVERAPLHRRQSRRDFLLALGGLLVAPATAQALGQTGSDAVQFAASWQVGSGHQVGVLELESGQTLNVRHVLEVPTRAHDLVLEPTGTLLAVARRPGNWLLRFDRSGHPLTWRWIEPGRAFAGHALTSPDGRLLFTTEIDQERETGLIGVRDAQTLEKQAEWPTGGHDPHMLVLDACQPGALIVANGGVPTRPETGRAKRDVQAMDSSLVRIDLRTGEHLQQWRLPDPRLSLRHLAWNGMCLGIALQAEHDDPAVKAAAPVLARLEADRLRLVEGPNLAGYGGSISAFEAGFAVSCPKAQCVAVYGAAGFSERISLAEACPLAQAEGRLWAGGQNRVLALEGRAASPTGAAVTSGIRLDNHWVAL